MLKRPIPAGTPRAQVLSELRKRIVESSKARPKKLGASFAMRGQRGTKNSAFVMEKIAKVAQGSGPNVGVAMKIIKVFKAAQEGTINPEADPFGGHQVLVNVANALFKTEVRNSKLREYSEVKLNLKQRAALEYWYNMAK
jgi:hypothetical protein